MIAVSWLIGNVEVFFSLYIIARKQLNRLNIM